jgi:hypothetical protein
VKPEKIFAWTITGALLLCLLIVQTVRWFSPDPLPRSNVKDDYRQAQSRQSTPFSPAKKSTLTPQPYLAAPPFDETLETPETPEMSIQTEDNDVDPSGTVGVVVPNEEPPLDLKAAGVIPEDQVALLDYEAETALQLEAAEQEAAMRAAIGDGNIDPSGAIGGDIPYDSPAPGPEATGVAR